MDVDPQQIRALARRVREQGAQARADAHDLVAHSRAVEWTGLAGAAMAGQTVAHARLLAHLADRHDQAARALDAHATAVEEALALIAEIERRVRAAVDQARGRLRRFMDGLQDAVDDADEALARFVAPPPGSPEWLRVRLPGLGLPRLR